MTSKRTRSKDADKQLVSDKEAKVQDGPKRRPIMLYTPGIRGSCMSYATSDPVDDSIEEFEDDKALLEEEEHHEQIKLDIRHGDITQPGPDVQWIAHQANCVTTGARGVAAAIFKRWPGANVYRMGKHANRVPGTITTMRFSGEPVGIIHCFAQNDIRKAGLLADGGPTQRVAWMKECLDYVDGMIPLGDTIAFPYGIGCDLGGCDWETDYAPMFAKWIHDTRRKIVFYKL